MKYIKYLLAISFVFSFFLLRPYHLEKTALIYAGDDQSYFAQATALAFFKFPDYSYEGYFVGEKSPMHSIGPGLLAAPFVFLFSQIDRIQGSSIVKSRQGSDIAGSWSSFGFIIATYFYFSMGWFLLYKGLRYYFEDKIAFLSILLMLFMQMTPLYVFRRPVFSHIYELFLGCSFIYLLLVNNKENITDKKSMPLIIGLISGLVYLVRYNNIFVALFVPVVLFCFDNNRFIFKGKLKKLATAYGVGILLIFVFKVIPTLYYGENYSVIATALWRTYAPWLYIKRVLHIIFGIDWGLLYTAPFALIGFAGLFLLKDNKIKKQLLILCIPLILNLYTIIVWGENGAWYSYRYLFFSLAPLVIFPFTALLHNFDKKYGYRKSLFFFLFISLIPLFPMLCFEGNATNLTIHLFKGYFAQMGFAANDWTNQTYQLEVWKTLVLHPQEFLKATFKAGPLYLMYLFALAGKLAKHLPSEVLEKYQSFNLVLLIKMAIIYTFPCFMYFLFGKSFKDAKGCKQQPAIEGKC